MNAVAPTFIKTPGTVKWLNDDAFRADLLSRIPLGRVGEPIDVAAAVVFLASPAAVADHGRDADDRRRLHRALNRRTSTRAEDRSRRSRRSRRRAAPA